ncbi:MAG: hypothetical protein ABI579_07330 [Candidatus Sumerlaeota bacterium]
MTFLTWLVLYLAALAVGREICVRGLRGDMLRFFHPLQVLMLEVLLGVGALGTIALLGNWAGVLPRGVAIAIPLLMAPWGAVILYGERHAIRMALSRVCNKRDIIWAIPVLLVCALYFRLAWFPRIGLDAWAYHFTVPKQWLMHGRLIEVPYEASANYYLLAQSWMFWGIAFSTDDFILPHLHTVMGVGAMTLFLLLELRRWVGPTMAWFFSLFFLLTDEMFEWAPSDYIDPAQGFYVLAGCVVAARAIGAQGTARRSLMIVAGLLIGFATGMKIMGVVVFGATFAVVAWMLWKERISVSAAQRFRPLVYLTLPFAIVVIPWVAKSIVFTGNPVYPLGVGFFPTFPQHVQSAVELQSVYPEYFLERTIWQKITFRLDQARRYIQQSYYIDQHLIVMVYAAAFCVFLLRKWKGAEERAAFGIAALLIGFTLFSPQRRFAIGTSLFQFLLIGVVVGRLWNDAWLQGKKRTIGLITVCLTAMLFNKIDDDINFFGYHGYREEFFSRHLFLTPASMERDAYEHESYYPLVKYIESNMTHDDLLMTAGTGMMVPLLDVPIFENSQINGKNLISTLADVEGNDAATIARRLHEWHITYIVGVYELSTEGEAGRFLREYLVPVKSAGSVTLYRLK